MSECSLSSAAGDLFYQVETQKAIFSPNGGGGGGVQGTQTNGNFYEVGGEKPKASSPTKIPLQRVQDVQLFALSLTTTNKIQFWHNVWHYPHEVGL